MRYSLENTRQAVLTPNVGTTSLKPTVGRGPAGPNTVPTDEAVGDALEGRGLPTTGTELSASIGPPVVAKAYGALGNGVANDAPAIQAALDAAAAAGRRQVYLPAGSYKITSTLNIPTGVELVGESAKSTVIQASGDIVAISIAGGEAQGLRRFRIANGFVGTRTTYDVVISNPFKPVLDQIEVALGQTSLGKGGIHIYKIPGQPGDDRCFMPELNNVWIRNGILVIEDVTDGKMTGGFVWSTYTGAAGGIQLARASNWTFNNVDIVPPQGDAGGYLLTDLNNLSILGGLMDGSYDDIMTGHGVKTTGFTRGLSIIGVKFFNLGRNGLKLNDVRRSSFVGNVFIQCNKADGTYHDVDMTACTQNTFVGNTHGAPNVRANKARCYVEDGTSADNAVRSPSVEVSSSISPNGHFYNTPLSSLQDTTSIRDGVPAVNWPTIFGLATKGTNYTITKPDLFENRTIVANTAGITLTLPSAGSVHAGDRVTLKNASAGNVSVATTSSQTIDGAAAPIALAAGAFGTFITTGSAWVRI